METIDSRHQKEGKDQRDLNLNHCVEINEGIGTTRTSRYRASENDDSFFKRFII